jgi:hypothetical protein
MSSFIESLSEEPLSSPSVQSRKPFPSLLLLKSGHLVTSCPVDYSAVAAAVISGGNWVEKENPSINLNLERQEMREEEEEETESMSLSVAVMNAMVRQCETEPIAKLWVEVAEKDLSLFGALNFWDRGSTGASVGRFICWVIAMYLLWNNIISYTLQT